MSNERWLTLAVFGFVAWLVAGALLDRGQADTIHEVADTETREWIHDAAVRGSLYVLGGKDDHGIPAAIRTDSKGRVYCSPEPLPE